LTVFAGEVGLALEVRPIHRIPSDLGAEPAACERLLSVVLSRRSAPDHRLSLVYGLATFGDAIREPSLEDVLWYLASDAESVEEARGSVDRWVEVRGYRRVDHAAVEAFELQRRTACELTKLLGDEAYQRLLGIYRARKRKG
jgi:hypothetical protein